MVHCLYLPYVDIFRTDRYIAAAIKQSAPNYASRVANTLRELPDEIERRLKEATLD